ncbi:MAG: FxsA family protein [Methylophilaceae bacterium]|nr:FxsA family protein [Methylophilaceae bacterium]
MRLLIILAILLVFPLTELYLLVRLGAVYGWALAAYLLFAAIAGWLMIAEERLAIFGRLFHIVQSGHHPALALLTSAKKMVAGLLLIFPGVISDLLAVLLLLIPLPVSRQRRQDAGWIEGEWRRED